MGDSYRKDFKRRNDYEYSRGRGSRSEKDRRQQSLDKLQMQPTILIKTRETDRAPSPGVANVVSTHKKDAEPTTSYQIQTKTPSTDAAPFPSDMPSSLGLLSKDMTGLQDACVEFLSDQRDFLVVGCLGRQGVGKSTIMSLLAQPNAQPFLTEKSIFPLQTAEEEASGLCGTSGINIYVTNNRIILLDCQPTLPTTLPSNYTADDNNAELQSLQLAAFLFSVCHVVLFVQDYFLDFDLIRYLQTAEMLKPSTSTAIGETMVEYFPHLVFIHNRADDWEFEPQRIKQIQEGYMKCFSHSRLQIQTGFGIANGDVSPMLDTTTCGPLVNVFLLPKCSSESGSTNLHTHEDEYTGHPAFKEIFRHLRNQILSTPRTPISHSLLTEKNWFLYAGKVWDSIQKSSFFKEYYRLISTM